MDSQTAMNRLNLIKSHVTQALTAGEGYRTSPAPQSDDDVVIVAYSRTALCKAKKGSFKDTAPEVLLAHVLRDVYTKANLDPARIQEVSVGNCLQPGAGATTSRMGGFLAGIPHTAALHAINRQCSSGLQAIAHVANAIKAGQFEIGIGAGVESMTNFSFNDAVKPDALSDDIFEMENARNCLMGMGVTSDNVAKQFNVSRQDQDEFGALSQQKALDRIDDLKSEITPLKTKIQDKEGNWKEIVADKDEGIRPGTTAAKLGKLKPVFDPKEGTTTAGNASQVTDGAAAVLLAKRSIARDLGLPIEGRYHGFTATGVPPHIMGIGPAVAIPEVLKRTGFTIGDVDVFEINEAFASQALYSARELNIPMEKVNPRGGAIALGHPLGATGARQLVTLFSELKKTGGRIGVTSMCIGTGMGAAGIFERE